MLLVACQSKSVPREASCEVEVELLDVVVLQEVF